MTEAPHGVLDLIMTGPVWVLARSDDWTDFLGREIHSRLTWREALQIRAELLTTDPDRIIHMTICQKELDRCRQCSC
ncbi:hypothetical protein PE067_08120 [Paracoccus sp. DMF-8]|uniref:hypothetical protein n=1 Tax=Paracoccus sp. DMF-8 TaxID=3019445 RepID=UPI0023E7ECE3|nr:hypothetical protein [Paracoccus sp. DMF-8]MDF3606093.1 hypothetical protein [Paracoccus sp. DMF-8]